MATYTVENRERSARCPALVYAAGWYYLLPPVFILAAIWAYSAVDIYAQFLPLYGLCTVVVLAGLFARLQAIRWGAIVLSCLTLGLFLYSTLTRGVNAHIISIGHFCNWGDVLRTICFFYALLTLPGAFCLLLPSARKWFA